MVADLFLFWYERDFMIPLSADKQADIIEGFNTTSRYFDDILKISKGAKIRNRTFIILT